MAVKKTELAIGLMSGTSADGIDGVLLAARAPDEVSAEVFAEVSIEATAHTEFPSETRAAIEALCARPNADLDQLGRLDTELGILFAQAANDLRKKTRENIAVIGCHGQTIRHRPAPPEKFPFTMQLGNGAVIARRAELPVVCDFRRADIAAGGQGAPLAAAFHRAVFSGDAPRAILNLGGIANVTCLPAASGASEKVRGFDTGPANTLIDHWCQMHFGAPYDRDGKNAAKGKVHDELLKKMLADSYFSRPPPKSTGREYFNAEWLGKFGKVAPPEDMLATLTALTAESAAAEIRRLQPRPSAVYVCGGGARNDTLMAMLAERFDGAVRTTAELGIEPQWVEAAAFAWMALCTLHRRASTLPSVTGADSASVAGVVHYPHPADCD
ncbi:MAG: anhydro-N-acetylmuramic acid kinase [Gammaproteobacteria bacterium]|nr:anhydro-N-acetylmuramic acid kinase [Gammaproteobacteria bacterium]